MEDILVSVICNAYNHEKYIRDALDGFVMQKTDFAFEVLIHDDASTDNTAAIIREYEQKYPELIKPIYQTENQYSQGKDINICFQYPRAKAKYIAFCEGDDYWTDPYKLQKQMNALEAHPEIDICAHAAKTTRNEQPVGMVAPAKEDTVLTVEQVIAGGGGYVATASLMYRREMIERQCAFAKVLSLDYVTQIRGALRGGMLYLSDCMSVYRLAVEGSWSVRVESVSDRIAEFKRKIVCMLWQLDEDTNHAYTATIADTCLRQEFAILQASGEYAAMRKPPYRQLYKRLSAKQKLKLLMKERFPRTLAWIAKRRQRN